MKKFVWPLLVIFFLIGGLVAILIGQVVLPPEPPVEPVEAISEKWDGSGHADAESESFIHWDEDDPPLIPESCAKCHSAHGYLDYLGEDGSEAGSVDAAAAVGTVVSCYVCHNPTAQTKDAAVFPSGATMDGLGQSANCAECHQGTRFSGDVDNAVGDLPEDEVNTDLGFVNVHYKIGGAVRFGAEVQVGYEYPGQSYLGYYPHVEDYQDCTDCHDAHSLLVTPSECAACHPVVSGFEDLRSIRMEDTLDYDGDGNTDEGVHGEIVTLHEMLYASMQQYANEVIGEPIIYADAFPYFFYDTNGNGEVDEGEANFGNQYKSWTPRLLKAAYNYQVIAKDPGGFMHNADYLIQLLHDSIMDLGQIVNLDTGGILRPE